MPGYAFLTVLGAVAVAVLAAAYIIRSQGGFWVGYQLITALSGRSCETCDGYGGLWLVDGRKIPVPRNMRAYNPDGSVNMKAGRSAALGNWSECRDCDGMGIVMLPVTGAPVYAPLPFPFPWRR